MPVQIRPFPPYRFPIPAGVPAPLLSPGGYREPTILESIRKRYGEIQESEGGRHIRPHSGSVPVPVLRPHPLPRVQGRGLPRKQVTESTHMKDAYADFQKNTMYGLPNLLTVWDALEHHEAEELDEAMMEQAHPTFLELEGYDDTGAYAMEIKSFAL